MDGLKGKFNWGSLISHSLLLHFHWNFKSTIITSQTQCWNPCKLLSNPELGYSSRRDVTIMVIQVFSSEFHLYANGALLWVLVMRFFGIYSDASIIEGDARSELPVVTRSSIAAIVTMKPRYCVITFSVSSILFSSRFMQMDLFFIWVFVIFNCCLLSHR